MTLVSESIPTGEAAGVRGPDGLGVSWVSSLGSDFKYDFGAAFTEEQQRSGAEYNFTSTRCRRSARG